MFTTGCFAGGYRVFEIVLDVHRFKYFALRGLSSVSSRSCDHCVSSRVWVTGLSLTRAPCRVPMQPRRMQFLPKIKECVLNLAVLVEVRPRLVLSVRWRPWWARIRRPPTPVDATNGCLQGRGEEEEPEQILGCVKLEKVDTTKLVQLPWYPTIA